MFCTIVLTHEDEAAGYCDGNQNFDIFKNLKVQIEKWKFHNQNKNFNILYVISEFQNALSNYEKIKKGCPRKVDSDIFKLGDITAGIFGKNYMLVESTVNRIANVEYLNQFVSLFCAFDCRLFFHFTTKMENFTAKKLIYNTMQNLLQKTNDTHKEIVTTIPFLEDLNRAVKEEKDARIVSELIALLSLAIYADLKSKHDNIEHLYAINSELTSHILLELILKYTSTSISNIHDLALYPLFDIIKCTTNFDIWVAHLEMVYEVFKEKNKLKSEHGVLLLKAIKQLQKEADISASEKQKLDKIETEIPSIIHTALRSKFCIGAKEAIHKSRIFIDLENNEFKLYKFQQNNNGTKALLSGNSNNYSFAIISDTFDFKDPFIISFDVNIQKALGDFTEVQQNNFCSEKESNWYACMNTESLLPTANLDVKYITAFHELSHYYFALGYCQRQVS